MATEANGAPELREPNVIYEGDTVICQTSDGRMFFQIVKKDESIRVGKKLTPLRPVIGSCYGTVFEEQNKKLVQVTGGLFPDPVAPGTDSAAMGGESKSVNTDVIVCLVFESAEIGDAFVPSNDNRHYTDTNSAQKLSSTEIGELREGGATGKEIIQKLVENSETWDTKTEFSKQKYLKKKQQKYMPRVRFIKCTAASLCRTYRAKNPGKICNMREDSLGQILVYGNIYATSKVLVVDTCMGLVTGAIAERQAGNGRILAGYEGQQPAADILRRFNFDKKTLRSVNYFPYSDVSLLPLQEKEIVVPETGARDGMTPEERKKIIEERVKSYSEAEQKQYEAKKQRRKENKVPRQPPAVIRDWIRQQADSLVIASHYDPEQMLLKFLPYLACSKPFVIYSEFLEPLTRTFLTLSQMDSVIDLQLNETWTREYQVLPGRTHPEMNMSACSGYLLTGIKIHEQAIDHLAGITPEATGASPAKKAKTEEES